MLPKLAGHVLHHTQRAAATVQSHAFRNVLGLQNQTAAPSSLTSWSNAASGSSSGWGSTGGAKSNTGNWFYQGYNGAGRSVTQGNSSTHDPTTGRPDEDEDHPPRQSSLVIKIRPRTRSTSVHLTGTGRQQRAETFGVLKIVQLHQARNQHVLAGSSIPKIEAHVEQGVIQHSPQVRTRRNSTASTSASLENPNESPDFVNALRTDPTPLSKADAGATTGSVDEADDSDLRKRFEIARQSNDPSFAAFEVQRFRQSHTKPAVYEYNDALHTLVYTRQNGEPLTSILETYNEMLTRQIKPDVRTYSIMILALCERDREVERIINQLRARQKWRTSAKRGGNTGDKADDQQLKLLRKEENFGSALLIFEAAQTLFRTKDSKRISFGTHVYDALLRSCMIHVNTNAAVRVWGALEQAEGYIPDATCYLHLLGTYTAANDIDSAKDVFGDFLLAAKEKRVAWPSKSRDDDTSVLLADNERSGKARTAHMLIWVKMVEAYIKAGDPQSAIGLLEQMMDSGNSLQFGETDVPPPCSALYTAFIRGFIETNDMDSALKWFDRMLTQDYLASRHPLSPTLTTPRPDRHTWRVLMDALTERGMRQQANDKYRILCDIAERDGLVIRSVDRYGIFGLNEKYLKMNDVSEEERGEIYTFLKECIFDERFIEGVADIAQLEYNSHLLGRFANLYAGDCRWCGEVLSILQRFVQSAVSAAHVREQTDGSEASTFRPSMEVLARLVIDVTSSALNGAQNSEPMVTISLLHSLFNLFELAQVSARKNNLDRVALDVLRKLRIRRELEQLGQFDWAMFFGSAARAFMTSNGDEQVKLSELRQVCNDISGAGLSPVMISSFLPTKLCQVIYSRYSDEADAIFRSLPVEWLSVARDVKMRTSLNGTPPTITDVKPVRVDKTQSRLVDEYFPTHPRISVHTAYARYEEGAKNGLYPLPDVVGRLLSSLGRVGELDKVHRLYNDGQQILAIYENNRQLQSHFWYCLEDQMIVSLAHAGQIEKAHVHRQRILDQGGVPSADAYGGLIQCVRETTDDSSNALALWNEAVQLGVTPNLYLYNTIISKLSRARKADLALELFRQMKSNKIRPSSVTYGAVIAACCRVGDAQSAEALFEEMASQMNFRPRIPPYNTMIQFYTHTIRNRERALFYYNALVATGIRPTAHTYKLLIDCFGTLEPVDIVAMEEVFAKLVSDEKVHITGVHWAALINAWGCVKKDLGKATDIFNSIASHPSTLHGNSNLPDSIVYEAMINVLVTLRRTDLIPLYLERLISSGIHMTAYIANLLIKGYAAAGDLVKSREVFESLQDPPAGVAAPNNHASHDDQLQARLTVDAPVYREPSTWEAMVRAELGSGNRERAEQLLLRVQERQFPPAVYGRISGIMLNDAVSPWFANNELSDSSAAQSPH